MKKYFWMQCKRLLRLMPLVLCVAAVLFGSLSVAYCAMVSLNEGSGAKTKFKVGLVGTAGDTYLQLGLAALESLDSSRYAIDIVTMTEPDAKKAMERGDISAFVVIPEGFVDAAMRGEIRPLKYVSTSGAVGLVTIFKDEITRAINDILLEAQKGIYGAGNALRDHGLSDAQAVNELSIAYTEFVFDRAKTYSVRELGISDGLGLEGYLFCGLSVLFLMLICLPFAPLLVRRDYALARMLAARRRPAAGQAASEFGAYLLGILILLTAVLLCFSLMGLKISASGLTILYALPAVLTVASLSFLLYQIPSDLISGVMLQFLAALFLCFISGCLYPGYFFPEAVQRIAAVLPTGIARAQLAGCITGAFSAGQTLALLGYSAAFFAAALIVRMRKVTWVRG